MAANIETIACFAFKAPSHVIVCDMDSAITRTVDTYMVNHENPTLYVLAGDVAITTDLLAKAGLPCVCEATTVTTDEWPQDFNDTMPDPDDCE